MDLTNPAVIAVVAIVASAVTTALTNLLMAWLGRRRTAAETAKTKAETDKINTDARRSLAEEDRAAMAHLIKVLEGSYNVKVGDLTQGMTALEKSHAAELKSMTAQLADLTEQVASLKTLMEGANETIKQQGATIKEANEMAKGQSETVLELSGELAGVRQELTVANETITGLNLQVADLKRIFTEETAALNGRISDLIDQIKGLGEVPVAADEGETVAATAGETAVKTD